MLAKASQVDQNLTQKLDSLNQQAYLAYNSDPRQAIRWSLEAVTRSLESGLYPQASVAYKNMGLAYWRLSSYDSSLYYYELGKELADSIGDELTGSKILNNMALVYRDRGQYSTSLDRYLEALEIQKRLEEYGSLAITLTNVGAIYFRLGEVDKAKEYLNQSLAMATRGNFALPECFGCSVAIEVYSKTRDYDRADAYYQRARQSCQKVKSKYYLGLASYNYALMLKKKQNLPAAISEFERSLAVMEDVGDRRKQAAVINQLGSIYYALNQITASKKYFTRAKHMAVEHGLLDELKTSYQFLYKIDSLGGRYAAALAGFHRFHELNDSLSRLQRFYALAEINVKYQTQQKEIENEVLRAERELQNEVINRQKLNARIYYIIIAASVLIIAVLIILVVVIRRSNISLRSMNLEINRQSLALEEKNQELHQTIDRLEQTQRQLIESEKMASLGSLSAGIGHEINNPLNFIKGSIEVLSKHYKETKLKVTDEIANKCFDAVNEGVDRASSIVKSLSHFSRMGDEMDEKCDLYEIIDNCLVILENKLKHRVQVTRKYSKEAAICVGNGGRIHQAFLNILSNAEQSIAESGEISIHGRLFNGSIGIRISDTGSGISQDNLSRIMEPFFTTKNPGEGTGLGLSITYRIIQEHGGTISVDSALGGGTTVSIVLPRKID